MFATAWQPDRAPARILCAGDDLGDLIQMQCRLDGEPDFVIIANALEAADALAAESAFDLIILDQRLERVGGHSFVEQLQDHSPDAERLIVVHRMTLAITRTIENDCRVMRLLHAPLSADVLCNAVADALLRHRARELRARAVPSVTSLGVHLFCTALTNRQS